MLSARREKVWQGDTTMGNIRRFSTVPARDPVLARYDAILGAKSTDLGLVLYAVRSVPDTPIRQDDYLFVPWGDSCWRKAARVSRVPRSKLAAVEATIGDALQVLAVNRMTCWDLRPSSSPDETVEKCRKTLRVRQRPHWSDSTSPLIVVRPLVSCISAPIEAMSDDGALFELLASVGGRMPKGRSAI